MCNADTVMSTKFAAKTNLEQFFQLIDENQDFIESRFKKGKKE